MAGEPPRPYRPSKADVLAAAGKLVPDVIASGLQVLFVGINPGLYTAAIGHHFGRPGNRFWPALYAAGITPRLLSPFEERELLSLGYGITNVVPWATARADELSEADLVAGGRQLVEKIERFYPHIVAFLGIGAYRTAFGRTQAGLGPQPEPIGPAQVWVLPNPSGLNAHYGLPELATMFRQVRDQSKG